MSLRVLIIDNSPARTAILEEALSDSSYIVVARLTSSANLIIGVEDLKPDIIIIGIESPDRDTLECMQHVTRDNPKPIVMFAEQGGNDTIQSAIRAGVSAYVIDGLSKNRVKSIMEVAIARFREFQAMQNELTEVKNKLAERRFIEKAKALLIEKHRMTEEEAYSALRKMAMNRNQRIAEVARNVISMLEMSS
ncbi:MAG TPA: ANTAR domain-containing protein [Gammaproteobacteria bacterium]